MIDADLIRAARAMLDLSQAELGQAAGLPMITIRKIERGASPGSVRTLKAIQDALEKRGIVFQEPGDMRPGGKGVRLKK
jgi:transcriptional regulator with XRE-family HTH domain